MNLERKGPKLKIDHAYRAGEVKNWLDANPGINPQLVDLYEKAEQARNQRQEQTPNDDSYRNTDFWDTADTDRMLEFFDRMQRMQK